MIGPNWYYIEPKGVDALNILEKKNFKKSGFEPLNGHLKIYARGPAHGHNMPVACPSAFPREKGPAVGKFGPSRYDGHIRPISDNDGPYLPVTYRQSNSARHIHRRAYSARHPHRRAKSACQIMTGPFCPSHTPTGIFCLSNNDGPILPVTYTDGHNLPVK